jgi:hypothetical protein
VSQPVGARRPAAPVNMTTGEILDPDPPVSTTGAR